MNGAHRRFAECRYFVRNSFDFTGAIGSPQNGGYYKKFPYFSALLSANHPFSFPGTKPALRFARYDLEAAQ